MENFLEKSCRLCLNIISDENFKVIQETIKEVVELLLFKLHIEEKIEPVICSTCLTRLFEAFQFKAICIDTEDTIFPYVNCKNTPVDLQEIYLKERGKEHLRTLLEDERICRLCMQIYTLGFTSVQDVEIDMIQKCIPEIDFSSTKDPVICKRCLSLLKAHSSFLKSCLDVEEQIKSFQKEEQSSLCIKVEEIEIKSEENDEDSDHHIRNLTGRTSETTLHSSSTCDHKAKCRSNLLHHQENHKTLKHKDSAEFQMYKCDACDYESKLKGNLTLHLLIHNDSSHKNISDVRKYVCDVCDYKAIHKYNLTRHKLKHNSTSEVQVYICHTCKFKTNRKDNLVQHQRRHRNILKLNQKSTSEMQVYICHICEYKTRWKGYLEKHQRKHKNFNLRKYECDVCDYKTSHKYNLTRHKLKHKSTSEVQVYICHTCKFKTNRKDHLVQHQRRHKNILNYERDVRNNKVNRKDYLISHQLNKKSRSEMQVYICHICEHKTRWRGNLEKHQRKHENFNLRKYECDVCDYKASQKYNLTRHKLKHKSTSEVQVYFCHTCNYKASRKDNLVQHQRTHKSTIEVQIYFCHACEFKTRYKGNLVQHQQRHKHLNV